MALRGGPKLRAPCQVGVFSGVPAPHPKSQTEGVAIQHAKYSMQHARIMAYEKARMQNTKIRKIKAAICSRCNRGGRTQDRGNPSQPGGPSSEGPADFLKYFGIFKSVNK